jgi:hypothetical protein
LPEFPANPNPQTPNVMMVMNFREVDSVQMLAAAKPVHVTYQGTLRAPDMTRKWSFWNIASPYADFCERADGTQQLLIGNGQTNSKVYQLTQNVWDDDCLPINSFYTTFGFPQTEGQQQLQLGMHELELVYGSLLVTGEGALHIREIPNTLTSQYAQDVPPLALTLDPINGDLELPFNDIGTRFFIRVGTNDCGDHFSLSRMVLAIRPSPWYPVKGVGY